MQERVREQYMWSETILEKCEKNSLQKNNNRQVSNISDEKWLQHFKKVFDVNSVEQGSDANTCSLHTLEINWNSCTEDDLF